MTNSFSIVLDSPSDFPRELESKYDIFIVPSRVHIGDKTYKDRLGITRKTLFHELERAKKDISTTEAPTKDFIETFDKAMEVSDHVLYLGISHKLSKSFQNATIAARKYRGRITLINTLSISHGVTLMAHHALLRREQGMELVPLVQELNEMIRDTRMYVLVENLKYLYKGGRIGRAQQTIGSLLNINPLLHLVDGELDALMSIRGTKASYAAICEKISEHAEEFENFVLAGSFGKENEKFQELSSSLKEELNPLYYCYDAIGPAVLSNVGPKVEALFITKIPDNVVEAYR
ncbi:MAG: DegV family protein [Candidatus Heimdallarchaeota archaeon]|nr:DegV family protein [Candidatus Heimdallarchaeota archaeon]